MCSENLKHALGSGKSSARRMITIRYVERNILMVFKKCTRVTEKVTPERYLRFPALFVFQNNAPFLQKTTNDDFRFVATTPQTNLGLLCTKCGFLPFPFSPCFYRCIDWIALLKELKLPKR